MTALKTGQTSTSTSSSVQDIDDFRNFVGLIRLRSRHLRWLTEKATTSEFAATAVTSNASSSLIPKLFQVYIFDYIVQADILLFGFFFLHFSDVGGATSFGAIVIWYG